MTVVATQHASQLQEEQGTREDLVVVCVSELSFAVHEVVVVEEVSTGAETVQRHDHVACNAVHLLGETVRKVCIVFQETKSVKS